MFRVRAVCNKREIVYRLDGRKFNWLIEEMEKMNIHMTSSSLTQLLNNKSNWLLTYAIALTKILDCNIDDIFELTEKTK